MKNTTAWFIVIGILVLIGIFAWVNGSKDKEATVVEVEENIPSDIVAENPEGEADPSRMKLDMHTWTWIRTTYNDGKEVKPLVEKKFTITFKNDKTFSATTDCNNMGGQYSATGDKISFSNIFATKMFCENSQESDFAKMLSDTQSYMFTSRGELILDLKFDSGSVIFR